MRGLAFSVLVLVGACVLDDVDANIHVTTDGGTASFENAIDLGMKSDGRWAAHADGPANVTVTRTEYLSPSQGSHTDRTTLVGVMPGDDVEVPSRPRTLLPEDCTCSTDAADLEVVDAIITTESAAGVFARTIRANDRTRGPGFTFVICADHDWNQLRPVIAAGDCPRR